MIFIDASREFQPAKMQNILLDEHIAKIVEAFKGRKEINKYARPVPLDEITRSDFNLNIPRYIDTFEAEDEIDIKTVQAEIEALDAELATIRAKMKGYLKELGIYA